MTDYILEHTDTVITNVHDPVNCAGRACPVHNLTQHVMRGYPQHFRYDNGLMERICLHGIGHPDPDAMPFYIERGEDYMSVHGCDGCCRPPSRLTEAQG